MNFIYLLFFFSNIKRFSEKVLNICINKLISEI